jgi:adenosylcobalamin-dependent ribonucleoside-triphosphate reductase
LSSDFNYAGWSARAILTYKRTYARPMNKEETEFEDYDQTIDRVINHQRWLWERAQNKPLNQPQERELAQLKLLALDRKSIPSGRVLWMGGTDISKIREVSQFACAATKIETVYDIVDSLWCLLNGTGIGFKPVVGSLTGFAKPIKDVQVIRSQKKIGEKGHPDNVEVWNPENKLWQIKVGDSSEAWAKAAGKIIAGKYPAKKLIIDFSEVRAAGSRLSNYGWISSGDENISAAFYAIVQILNKKAGSLLTKMDILDILNWLGTSLSSRRAAEIAFVDYGSNEWEEFAIAKKDYWLNNNDHRASSNNSLAFYKKPSIEELKHIFNIMSETGGAEPGFLNANEAERRAPWFIAGNPCMEILLPNKGFCNLFEIDVSKFRGDTHGLHEAARLAARANYRQTCVNLKDGVLQEAWHLNNDFLRLCGIGLTGIARRGDMIDHDYRQLERVVVNATYSIADELDMPRPKNITCIKPSGTLSKLMDTTEGLHKPLGKYIFNNIIFVKTDPLLNTLREAGYIIFDHPSRQGESLVTFPVCYEDIEFDRVGLDNGEIIEVNLESAIDQLNRYKMLQNNWTHQNSSCTISYTPDETPEIVKWMHDNWDNGIVGVSFMYRIDPLATPESSGFPYLPQQCVTKSRYDEYVAKLKPLWFGNIDSIATDLSGNCSDGNCATR